MKPFINTKAPAKVKRKPLPSQETAMAVSGRTSSASGGSGGGQRRGPPVKCYRCGESGHMARECGTLSAASASSLEGSSLKIWKPPAGDGASTAKRLAERRGDGAGHHRGEQQTHRGGGGDRGDRDRPAAKRRRRRRDEDVDDGRHEWGKRDGEGEGEDDGSGSGSPAGPVELPNFEVSGALLRDTNATEEGVVKTHVEPAEAKLPTERWRCYVFKGEQQLDTLHLHRRTCYLFGRDDRVADVALHHPSVSGQHAVVQFRQVPSGAADGSQVVKPYIMDLQSTNGTKLNGTMIQDSRYIELKPTDCLQFGSSTREFVLLTESAVE